MLTLGNILEAEKIDPKDVLLIRHRGEDPRAAETMDKGLLREFTSIQNPETDPWNKETLAGTKHKLWLVFVGVGGGWASQLEAVYLYDGEGHIVQRGDLPEEYPENAVIYDKDWMFQLKESDLLSDYRRRLLVDWPHSPRSYYSDKDMPVLRIADPEAEPFLGFDEIHLTRRQLLAMYADPVRYRHWETALSSVQAVYVIACTMCGKLYIGSATGGKNLWQRWQQYADSKDGSADNTGIKAHIHEHPEHLASFRYSMLQTFAPSTDKHAVLYAEHRFMKCVDSVQHGMNDN